MPADGAGCIILLAAGEARRFGSAKQLVPIHGTAMVRHCALVALACASRVIVISGAHRSNVEEQLAGLPVTLVWNPDWEKGMGGSIACGVARARHLEPLPPAVMICLADQPAVTADDLGMLWAEHLRAPGSIVAAAAGSFTGPPCLFPSAYFADLEQLDGAHGARALLEKHAQTLRTVSLPSAAMDIDARADYDRFLGASANPGSNH
jgi:molybdenum cofactor cytidylyltransferase